MNQGSVNEFDFTGMKVLIVEDNDFVRTMIAKFLTEFGIKEILYATNGDEGLSMLAANPNLILCDIHMNPTNGISLLEHVRSLSTVQNMTAFIIFTADTQTSFVRKARDLGVDAYLLKPVSAALLKKTIATVMVGHAS